MAVDEARRHELHAAARRTLGESPGDTLMELLPPVGWADVATKHDLATVKRDVELQIAALTSEVKAIVLTSEHRILFWMFTTMLGGLAIAVTVARSI
jgi:hypothetical protein